MADGIPSANILQPGVISAANAQRALVSQLQLLKPAYYKRFTEIYGDELFTPWLSTFGGMEITTNRLFNWYQNRGKLMPGITITGSTQTSTLGSTITLTLSSGDHFNAGTQTPLRVGETLRGAKDNIEWEILTIPVTTAFAFQFTVRPKKATTTASVASGDILIFGGQMDAGEASSDINPLIPLDQALSNTTTEMRDTWAATDRAEMTEVWYDSGVTGSEPQGGSQAGTSYFTYKGLVYTNKRYINNIENKLMKGDVVTNTGLNSSTTVGTQGFIPAVLAQGEQVGYTNIDISKLHEITRIMDINGCAKDNLWMMDIYQRQSFSDGIFKEFPAGAWVWGKNENSEEAAIAYGVQSMKIDEYMFRAKKQARMFNTEVSTGKTPDPDYFRRFGIICPLGETPDARNSAKVYKNITIMVENPVGGGTTGNGIRVWQHGGGSKNPTDGTMVDYVSMICYKGVRVVAGNQFVIVGAGF
jgi:hypothetical protein